MTAQHTRVQIDKVNFAVLWVFGIHQLRVAVTFFFFRDSPQADTSSPGLLPGSERSLTLTSKLLCSLMLFTSFPGGTGAPAEGTGNGSNDLRSRSAPLFGHHAGGCGVQKLPVGPLRSVDQQQVAPPRPARRNNSPPASGTRESLSTKTEGVGSGIAIGNRNFSSIF